MTPDIAHDERLDPRLRRLLELFPATGLGDVADREELLAEANTPEAVAAREAFRGVPGPVRHRGGGSVGRPVA